MFLNFSSKRLNYIFRKIFQKSYLWSILLSQWDIIHLQYLKQNIDIEVGAFLYDDVINGRPLFPIVILTLNFLQLEFCMNVK
jgi:hypothetical protein